MGINVGASKMHNKDFEISKSISCLYMHHQAVTPLQLPLEKENQTECIRYHE